MTSKYIGIQVNDLTIIKKINENKFLGLCKFNHEQVISIDSIVASTKKDVKVKSCCNQCKIDMVLSTKFSMLQPVEYLKEKSAPPKYRKFFQCLCDCGKETEVRLDCLKDGSIQSCGCIQGKLPQKELDRRNDPIFQEAKWSKFRNYNDHSIRNAKILFQNSYNDGDLDFEIDFLKLTKQNCFYCNDEPKFIYDKLKGYHYSCPETAYIYNGLDRLDNSFPHNKNNVITACKICNRIKNMRNYDSFIDFIKNANVSFFPKEEYKTISPLKDVKWWHKSILKRYDNDLSFDEFYQLSQQNCFYCNKSPENSNSTKGFKYNGMDRVDSNFNHNINNVVPSCIECNFGKLEMDLYTFYHHILKIRNNLHTMGII